MSASLPTLLPQPPKIRVHATCPVRFEGAAAVLRCLTPSRSIVDVEIDGGIWRATFGVPLPVPAEKPRHKNRFNGVLLPLIDPALPTPMRRALEIALEEFPKGFGFGRAAHDALVAHAEKHRVPSRAFSKQWTISRSRFFNRRGKAARASSLASSDSAGACRETAQAGGALGCAPSALGKSNHR